MGSSGGGARASKGRWRRPHSLVVASICLITLVGCANAFPTTAQDNANTTDRDGQMADTRNPDLVNVGGNDTFTSFNKAKQESDSLEKHVGVPSAEVSEPPFMEQEAAIGAANGDDRSTRLDYYDDLQLPRDPDEDDTPVLPEHAINVNEDYAGIYDYRGSPDGRYRRKRTLTTNIEQLLTRSSRLNRMRRSVAGNSLLDSSSPAERAEKLVSLLGVLQDADPAFDANDFLKVLHAPSVSEQDLEYLIHLSNIAALTDAGELPLPNGEQDVTFGQRQFDVPEEDSLRSNTGYPTWSQISLPELVKVAQMQQRPHEEQQSRHTLQQLSESFLPVSDLVMPDDGGDAPKREQNGRPSSPSSKDFSRLFAIAAMMAQRQEDPAGIAM